MLNFNEINVLGNILDTTYTIQLAINHQYFWQVTALDKDDQYTYADETNDLWSFTLGSLSNNELFLPEKYSLTNIYPNPFNPVTNISYSLPEITNISLTVYDMTGREISVLYSGTQSPGNHIISWDASVQSSGIYFINMTAGDFLSTQKLMLLK